jgi:hypothetical protein
VRTLTRQFLVKNPEYRKALEAVSIPERIIQFRVTWERDDGSMAVNRAYRVQVSPNRACAWIALITYSSTLLSARTRVDSVCTRLSTSRS